MCVSRVAAASGAVPVHRGLLPLTDVPDCECRDGRPERVIRRKHSVIPMPVLPRRRHEIGQAVQKLKRRELDDAAGPWLCGLSRAARADPGGGLVSGEHVADFGCVAQRILQTRRSRPAPEQTVEQLCRRRMRRSASLKTSAVWGVA